MGAALNVEREREPLVEEEGRERLACGSEEEEDEDGDDDDDDDDDDEDAGAVELEDSCGRDLFDIFVIRSKATRSCQEVPVSSTTNL